MAKVLGVGGIFFKSTDPDSLRKWYHENLNIDMSDDCATSFFPAKLPDGSFTVWSPFKATTKYFDPSAKAFMFNLIVDDLEGALKQVQSGGAQLVDKVEEYEFGSFGWFIDPEGNKVELWQPKKVD